MGVLISQIVNGKTGLWYEDAFSFEALLNSQVKIVPSLEKRKRHFMLYLNIK